MTLLLLEFLLSFAPKVPDQPLRGKGVLRRHPPPHNSVQEGLSLPRVESQHLPVKQSCIISVEFNSHIGQSLQSYYKANSQPNTPAAIIGVINELREKLEMNSPSTNLQLQTVGLSVK